MLWAGTAQHTRHPSPHPGVGKQKPGRDRVRAGGAGAGREASRRRTPSRDRDRRDRDGRGRPPNPVLGATRSVGRWFPQYLASGFGLSGHFACGCQASPTFRMKCFRIPIEISRSIFFVCPTILRRFCTASQLCFPDPNGAGPSRSRLPPGPKPVPSKRPEDEWDQLGQGPRIPHPGDSELHTPSFFGDLFVYTREQCPFTTEINLLMIFSSTRDLQKANFFLPALCGDFFCIFCHIFFQKVSKMALLALFGGARIAAWCLTLG